MQRRTRYTLIVLLLVTGFIAQPILQTLQMQLLPRTQLTLARAGVVYAQGNNNKIFLPIIAKGGTTSPADPPAFEIMTPLAGHSVGGTSFFAIQPLNAPTITSVSFKAGNTLLGTDNDGANGYRVFVDASTLAAGVTEFSATATGPGGAVTKSVAVNVVPNPPTSATVGQAGGVLASEIGSVISIRPGSVPDGTTISVDELTQAETTARHGINWDAMGVTFLGAQDVQSSVPISGPFGMVASAGFGNRVQPGQAVVNYRIAPDADGDGVDEIVVVNTASVAPNGDVIADPQKQIILVQQSSTVRSSMLTEPQLDISGSPGKLIELKLDGLNYYSFAGNQAKFRSLVNNIEIIVAGQVDFDPDDAQKHIFRVGIPYLPIGGAILTIQNSSTGYESEPIMLQIEPLPPLTRPAKVIFEEYFQKYQAVLNESKVELEQNSQLNSLAGQQIPQAITNITLAQTSIHEAYALLETTPVPEVQNYLDDVAKMIEMSEILKISPAQRSSLIIQDGCQPPENLSPDEIKKGLISIMPLPFYAAPAVGEKIDPIDLAGTAAEAAGKGTLATVINSANSGWKIGNFIKKLFNNISKALDYANNQSQGKCKDKPPPSPNPGGNRSSGGNTTGMGAAPPPGGNGFGSGAGGGRRSSFLTASQLQQQTSPVMVKIFSNGRATPFTGMADSGGYFFVPFIPAGEPFTAIAIDTVTGETRSFAGTGPATGTSVFMFFDFFNAETFVPSIQWDGGGDGRSWHDAKNWNTDKVPAASDRALIDVPGEQTITFSEGNTTLISLISAENMEFTGGELTLNAKSTISGALTMRGSFGLVVDGLGASFTAPGATIATGVNFLASNGGKIILPAMTRFEGEGGDYFTTLRAEGTGSLLDLSAVTFLIGTSYVQAALRLEAVNGGKLDLSSLATISTGQIDFTADGAGSTIDLSALTRFTRDDRGASSLEAVNGGTILVAQLTELRGVGLFLNGTGTLATSQIAIFTGGKAEVTGTTPDFSAMTDVDGSSFIVKSGGKVALPQVTSYAGDGEGSGFYTVLEAEGAGSLLDLSTITVLAGNRFVSDYLGVTAKGGGKIDLHSVSSITVGKVQFTADGSGSTIDLSALTRFARDGRGDSSLKPVFNGTILANQLTELRGIELILDGTGTLATSQITIFTGGRAEVTAMTPDFSGMTDVDGSSFIVKGGGKVALPQVTSYAGDGEGSGFYTVLEAEGVGSVLDLSNVTTFAGNTFVNDDLGVTAVSGGKIDLSRVNKIEVGKVQFTAEDSGSLIDLASLTQFTRSGRGESFLKVLQNGTINLASNTVTIHDVEVIVEENGIYAVGTFQLDAGSTLSGNGTLPASIMNGGSVTPGSSAGKLQIDGTYAQTITGTLALEFNGKAAGSEFDQLQITGNATLHGTLDLSLINNYSPQIGDSFVILTAAAVSGGFTTVNGAEIGNNRKFEVVYGPNSVTVSVVAVN